MGLLSKTDFELEESQGNLLFSNRLPYSAFSLNLRLEQLFRLRPEVRMLSPNSDLDDDAFLEKFTEEVPLADEGMVVASNDFYLWRSLEEIVLPSYLTGEITSRSSWARLGARVQDCATHLKELGRSYRGKPLCNFKATGTTPRIRRGDQVGQLFLRDQNYRHTFDYELVSLVDSGELVVSRHGNNCSSADLVFSQGIILTMGSDILVYRGGVLEPGVRKEDFFEKVDLHDYPQGYYLPQGKFFISASAEYVVIPPSYVGYVRERNFEAWLPFASHADAPYVGPKGVFEGNITFENWMIIDGVIKPGMMLSTLSLVPLRTLLTSGEASRYNGQNGATLSKL